MLGSQIEELIMLWSQSGPGSYQRPGEKTTCVLFALTGCDTPFCLVEAHEDTDALQALTSLIGRMGRLGQSGEWGAAKVVSATSSQKDN